MVRGFTHTIRNATSDRRSISFRSWAGSPVSQPSETIRITAPRAIPRRPQESLNSRSAAPILVPPSQSGAACPARSMAGPGAERARAGVSRVSRVAKLNTSARAPPAAQYRSWIMALA